MKKYRRILTRFFSLFILIIWTTPCTAAENAVREVLKDSIYGGITGSLVGAAVMAFTKRAGDHLDYLGYGAAGGALVGAAVGLTLINRSLAELEGGKVRFAIPAVIPEFKEAGSTGESAFVINGELLSGKF